MQNVKYFLSVIDVLTKYGWFKLLRNKKVKQFIMLLSKIANESNPTPYILWVDQGREFYNKLMQECLSNSNVLM